MHVHQQAEGHAPRVMPVSAYLVAREMLVNLRLLVRPWVIQDVVSCIFTVRGSDCRPRREATCLAFVLFRCASGQDSSELTGFTVSISPTQGVSSLKFCFPLLRIISTSVGKV